MPLEGQLHGAYFGSFRYDSIHAPGISSTSVPAAAPLLGLVTQCGAGCGAAARTLLPLRPPLPWLYQQGRMKLPWLQQARRRQRQA